MGDSEEEKQKRGEKREKKVHNVNLLVVCVAFC